MHHNLSTFTGFMKFLEILVKIAFLRLLLNLDSIKMVTVVFLGCVDSGRKCAKCVNRDSCTRRNSFEAFRRSCYLDTVWDARFWLFFYFRSKCYTKKKCDEKSARIVVIHFAPIELFPNLCMHVLCMVGLADPS